MRVIVVCLTYVSSVLGEVYTFPVKSINLNAAASVNFYVSPDLLSPVNYGLYDIHPVHGALLSDGSVVMTGKCVESDGGTLKNAFAVKMSATGGVQWVWKSTATGVEDAANAVVQLPNGGDLIVAGYREVNGVNKRSLTKLALSDKTEAWTALWDASDASKHGAWEMIERSPDDTYVLLAGLTDASHRSEFNFKSYGNVGSGTACIVKLPVSELGSTAPVVSDASWTYTNADYYTSKAARALNDGSAIALLYHEAPGFERQCTLVKLNSTGAVGWGPLKFGNTHGEGTDIVVAQDQQSFLISGQGPGGIAGSLSGRITKVSANGVLQWSKSYPSIPYDGSAGTNANLIKNECWGINAMPDGYVMGCGTGVEDCNDMSGAKLQTCNDGTADQRSGAYPRAKSVWQSMIVRTDLDGNLKWQRTDQYKPAESPALGQPGWTALSSACEYILPISGGGFFAINDEVGGIGLMRLNAEPFSPSPPPSPGRSKTVSWG